MPDFLSALLKEPDFHSTFPKEPDLFATLLWTLICFSQAEHIQKGVQCLNKEVDIQTADMYTLALSSYAYILAGSPHTDTLLERLNELAVGKCFLLTHFIVPSPLTYTHLSWDRFHKELMLILTASSSC